MKINVRYRTTSCRPRLHAGFRTFFLCKKNAGFYRVSTGLVISYSKANFLLTTLPEIGIIGYRFVDNGQARRQVHKRQLRRKILNGEGF
jgi:hypothetical protein